MIVSNGSQTYWQGVPSRGRHLNIGKSFNKSQSIGPATWYVYEDEVEKYERIANNRGIRDKLDIKVRTKPGLAAGRNQILEDAFERGLPCAFLDDDLIDVHHYAWLQRYKGDVRVTSFTSKISPQVAFSKMLQRLDKTPFYMASGRVHQAPWFFMHPLNDSTSVRANALLVKPNDLRFNEEFPHHEESDLALQHLKKYGGILNNLDIYFDSQSQTNPGGIVDLRTVEMADKLGELFEKYWPDHVKYYGDFRSKLKYAKIRKDFVKKEGGLVKLQTQIPDEALGILIDLVLERNDCSSISEVLLDVAKQDYSLR